MENIENVDVDSFDMVERTEQEEQALREQEAIENENTSFIDTNIRPGHFSYDILEQKFGMDGIEVSMIGRKIGGFHMFDNISFPRLVTEHGELQEAVVAYAFESSNIFVDSEFLKPLIDKLTFFVRESDGRLQARFSNTSVKGKNFFIMDQHGDIEYFKKSDRTEYITAAEQRYTMKINYLKGYGLDKRIISNIEANDIFNKGKKLIETKNEKIKKEIIKSVIVEIGESSKNNDNDGGNANGDLEEEEPPEVKKQQFTLTHIKEEFKKYSNKLINRKENEVDNEEFERVSLNELEDSLNELEETFPLKVRLKNIIKEHGVTIASVTVMVGTIITSIATSLANSATTVATSDSSIKKEIEELKEKNEELKKDEIKNKDEIEKNDKKIKELEDKINNKKSIWEYVKQVAKYILTGFTSLLSLIGKIIGIIGKALMSLGWIIYIVIAALAALAYGYYENKHK